MLRRGEERYPSAERVADEVRLLEPEVVDQGRDVVGHEPDVDRPIDVCGAAVPLEVDRDDLVALGQHREDRPEHLTRAEPPVEQDQRPPDTVGLVVKVDAVDLGVSVGPVLIGRPVRGHPSSSWVVAGWCAVMILRPSPAPVSLTGLMTSP